jgi:hypothetical protein
MAELPARIKSFNTICALVFEELYETFPIGADLKFVDIIAKAPELEDMDAIDIEASEEMFRHTLRWLEEEGFVRVGSKTLGGGIHDVRLTMMGFAVLGQIPQAVETAKAPLIDRVKQALGRGGAVASSEALRLVVGSVFGAVLAS